MASLKSSKPILVTGGAKRIGLAIAQRFARLGHPVIIHASPRTAEAAEAETMSLVRSGFIARCIIADLSKIEETAGLIEQASEFYGPLETLVNNASVFEVDAAENFDIACKKSKNFQEIKVLENIGMDRAFDNLEHYSFGEISEKVEEIFEVEIFSHHHA